MYYNFYYLCEDEGIIRILAKRKPSRFTIPKSYTWVVREYVNSSNSGKWVMPCYPEITWRRLLELQYIGKTIQKEQK